MIPLTFLKRVSLLRDQLAPMPCSGEIEGRGMSQGPRRPKPMERSRFRHFEEIHSRWEDQDCYRHINNVVAYSFFDTAVNRHMMQAAGFSIHDPHVGFVVNSS